MKIISHRDISLSRVRAASLSLFLFFLSNPPTRGPKVPYFFAARQRRKLISIPAFVLFRLFFFFFHHAGISDTLNGSLPILELISTQCLPRQLSATLASVIQLHNKKAKAYTKLTLPLSYFTT